MRDVLEAGIGGPAFGEYEEGEFEQGIGVPRTELGRIWEMCGENVRVLKEGVGRTVEWVQVIKGKATGD
jgi:hypothetical protein